MSDQTMPPADAADTKRCPICAEQVKAAALICRFCGHDFRPAASQAPEGSGGTAPAPPIWTSPAPAPSADAPPSQPWGQWGTAPAVQTGGALPMPATVPGTGYPVVPQRRTNGYAVAALVLGILLFWGPGGVLPLIFGYVGKGQIERSGGMETGEGMAIVGIVLGWIGIGITVLGIIGLAAGRGTGY